MRTGIPSAVLEVEKGSDAVLRIIGGGGGGGGRRGHQKRSHDEATVAE